MILLDYHYLVNEILSDLLVEFCCMLMQVRGILLFGVRSDFILRKFTDYEAMAMLCLSESERASLKGRFEEISEGFSALDAFTAEGVLPLVSVLDSANILREDISSKFMPREDLLKNAPQSHDGYFQVPAAID